MTTIGERLGAPKHGYIQPQYRDDTGGVARDGDGNRQVILAYIQAHSGEILDQGVMAQDLEISRSNLNNHLRLLSRRGKITVERAGVKRRYWYGSYKNGPASVKKPAQPLSRSQFRYVDDAAWDYIKSLNGEEVANQIAGTLGFLSHLQAKSPRETQHNDNSSTID